MGTAYAAISFFYTESDGVKRSLTSALGTTVAWIRTKAMSIGDSKLVYFIDQITTHLKDSANLRNMVLEVYGSDEEDGPFELLDTIDLSLKDPGFMDPPGQKYYELVYRDNAVTQRWKLHGFDVYGEPGGDEF
jgi:hypothetical protein